MNKDTEKSRAYIRADDRGRILRCEGEYTLPAALDGWTLIEEGPPCDRLNLAQSHYFDGGLYTGDGIPRYRWDGTQAILRTPEEIGADRAARPAAVIPPSTIELAEENKLLRAQLMAASDRQEFLEDCIAEMAGQVYNI